MGADLATRAVSPLAEMLRRCGGHSRRFVGVAGRERALRTVSVPTTGGVFPDGVDAAVSPTACPLGITSATATVGHDGAGLGGDYGDGEGGPKWTGIGYDRTNGQCRA